MGPPLTTVILSASWQQRKCGLQKLLPQ